MRVLAGEISELKVHTPYQITVNGHKICKVYDDISYTENGKRVALDFKGMDTPYSRLKRKLVIAYYPDIEWRVIKK